MGVEDVYPCYNKNTNTNENSLFGPYVSFENIHIDTDEGAMRPGHFRGVGTVLTKLLSWIRPNKSIFGQKDFVQCIAVKNLCREFFPDTEVIIHATVREHDGLAMSSRNNKLSFAERERAPLIYQCLCVIACHLFDSLDFNETQNGIKLDNELDALSFIQNNEMVISIAGSVGKSTRLIDNIVIGGRDKNYELWKGVKRNPMTKTF